MPILITILATVITGARTASAWGLAIAFGLALLAVSRARDADAVLRRPDSQAWSANRRNLNVSKSARGFHFPAQGYVFYLLLPQATAGLY